MGNRVKRVKAAYLSHETHEVPVLPRARAVDGRVSHELAVHLHCRVEADGAFLTPGTRQQRDQLSVALRTATNTRNERVPWPEEEINFIGVICKTEDFKRDRAKPNSTSFLERCKPKRPPVVTYISRVSHRSFNTNGPDATRLFSQSNVHARLRESNTNINTGTSCTARRVSLYFSYGTVCVNVSYHEVVLHSPADGARHPYDVGLDTVHVKVLRQVRRIGRGRVSSDKLSTKNTKQRNHVEQQNRRHEATIIESRHVPLSTTKLIYVSVCRLGEGYAHDNFQGRPASKQCTKCISYCTSISALFIYVVCGHKDGAGECSVGCNKEEGGGG